MSRWNSSVRLSRGSGERSPSMGKTFPRTIPGEAGTTLGEPGNNPGNLTPEFHLRKQLQELFCCSSFLLLTTALQGLKIFQCQNGVYLNFFHKIAIQGFPEKGVLSKTERTSNYLRNQMKDIQKGLRANDGI